MTKLCNTCEYIRYCARSGIEDVGCDRYKMDTTTNEEWLRSASANDMARCIATKLLELARHEYGIYDVVDYATIFNWLKEVHNDG